MCKKYSLKYIKFLKQVRFDDTSSCTRYYMRIKYGSLLWHLNMESYCGT